MVQKQLSLWVSHVRESCTCQRRNQLHCCLAKYSISGSEVGFADVILTQPAMCVFAITKIYVDVCCPWLDVCKSHLWIFPSLTWLIRNGSTKSLLHVHSLCFMVYIAREKKRKEAGSRFHHQWGVSSKTFESIKATRAWGPEVQIHPPAHVAPWILQQR